MDARMIKLLVRVRGSDIRVISGDGVCVLYSITPREHNHESF